MKCPYLILITITSPAVNLGISDAFRLAHVRTHQRQNEVFRTSNPQSITFDRVELIEEIFSRGKQGHLEWICNSTNPGKLATTIDTQLAMGHLTLSIRNDHHLYLVLSTKQAIMCIYIHKALLNL